MDSAVSTTLDTTAFAYQGESRSMYAAIASMSSSASGDQTKVRAIYQGAPWQIREKQHLLNQHD